MNDAESSQLPTSAVPAVVPPWPLEVWRVLKSNNVRHVSYVPDAGHARLIELVNADPDMVCNVLTTEEEGVAIAAGAWLGGAEAPIKLVNPNISPITVEWGRELYQYVVAGKRLAFSVAYARHHARRMGRVQSVAGADE